MLRYFQLFILFLGLSSTLCVEEEYVAPEYPEDISAIAGPPRSVRAILTETVGGGRPGEDFPVLNAVPKTDFSCRGLPPGYYADTSTGCQAFHICHSETRKDSFLCPNGTMFHQLRLICDWWYNVDCETSQLHQTANADIGKVQKSASGSDFSNNQISSFAKKSQSNSFKNNNQKLSSNSQLNSGNGNQGFLNNNNNNNANSFSRNINSNPFNNNNNNNQNNKFSTSNANNNGGVVLANSSPQTKPPFVQKQTNSFGSPLQIPTKPNNNFKQQTFNSPSKPTLTPPPRSSFTTRQRGTFTTRPTTLKPSNHFDISKNDISSNVATFTSNGATVTQSKPFNQGRKSTPTVANSFRSTSRRVTNAFTRTTQAPARINTTPKPRPTNSPSRFFNPPINNIVKNTGGIPLGQPVLFSNKQNRNSKTNTINNGVSKPTFGSPIITAGFGSLSKNRNNRLNNNINNKNTFGSNSRSTKPISNNPFQFTTEPPITTLRPFLNEFTQSSGFNVGNRNNLGKPAINVAPASNHFSLPSPNLSFGIKLDTNNNQRNPISSRPSSNNNFNSNTVGIPLINNRQTTRRPQQNTQINRQSTRQPNRQFTQQPIRQSTRQPNRLSTRVQTTRQPIRTTTRQPIRTTTRQPFRATTRRPVQRPVSRTPQNPFQNINNGIGSSFTVAPRRQSSGISIPVNRGPSRTSSRTRNNINRFFGRVDDDRFDLDDRFDDDRFDDDRFDDDRFDLDDRFDDDRFDLDDRFDDDRFDDDRFDGDRFDDDRFDLDDRFDDDRFDGDRFDDDRFDLDDRFDDDRFDDDRFDLDDRFDDDRFDNKFDGDRFDDDFFDIDDDLDDLFDDDNFVLQSRIRNNNNFRRSPQRDDAPKPPAEILSPPPLV